jgi:hypothetical protein
MRLTLAAAIFALSTTVALAQTPLTGTTGQLGLPGQRTVTPPSAAATAPVTPYRSAYPRPTAAAPPAAAAVAAPATPGTDAAAAATPARRRRGTLQERFDAANTTHDGHLTLEQARAKMPSTARDFSLIDTTHKGYVTIDDIHARNRARAAARRAAKAAQTAPAK